MNGLVSSCSLQNPSFPEVEGFLKLFYILYEGLSRALFEPPDVKEFFRYVSFLLPHNSPSNFTYIFISLPPSPPTTPTTTITTTITTGCLPCHPIQCPQLPQYCCQINVLGCHQTLFCLCSPLNVPHNGC